MLATPRAETSRRLPELDGIRGVAVLMVVYQHYVANTLPIQAWQLPAILERAFVYSRTGVDLFFVLSGFLIGGILLDNRRSPRFFSTFYARRFWRIVPLYAVLLLSVALGAWLAGVLGATRIGAVLEPGVPWYAYALFLQNFFVPLVQNFGGPSLAVTWSLAVEEHFYLTLPLLVWLLRGREKTLVLVLGLLVLLAPIVRALLLAAWPEGGTTAAQFYTPARLDQLGLGVLGALAVRNGALRRALSSGPWPLVALAAVAALVLLSPYPLGVVPGGAEVYAASVLGVLYLCLLLLAVLFSRGAWARLLRARPLVVAGTVAYGAYLLHVPLLWLTSYAVLGAYSGVVEGAADVGVRALAFATTVALALLSWHHFEKPLIRRGYRRKY